MGNAIAYYFCGFAVPVFFMASGYILMQRKGIMWSYVIRKYKNILKVVLLWGGFGALFIVGKGVLAHQPVGLIFWHAVRIFVGSLGGLLQKGFFFHFWFFGALLLLYAMLPFLTVLRKRQIKFLWLTMLVVSLLVEMVSYYVGAPMQKHVIQTFRLWTWMQYFLLGGLMPAILSRMRKYSLCLHTMALAIWTILLLLYQYHIGQGVLKPSAESVQYAEYFYDSFSDVVWCTLLFSWGLRLNLSSASVRVIGGITPYVMGIYILHPMVLAVVRHFYKVDVPIDALVVCVSVFMGTACAAWIMHKVSILRSLVRL